MITNERDTRHERVIQVANEMMTAARTAPKGRGFDIVEVSMITDDSIKELSDAMIDYSEEIGLKFFERDAENILHAEAIVLIGTKLEVHELDCGYCGFRTCSIKDQYPEVPCAINIVDVGIAIGSACAVAADHKVDNRVMLSAGKVVQILDWMPDCTSIYAIPLSVSSKNPFFDRNHKT